ncbi:gamma-glutamyltransferase [Flavisolibacter ginsengisoli]|jgi:gamma-glutamyltranspeptidase/glutathione hydrolase|uniref:Glutathione hydrolase proenzyme n=1 Tax=Flavisolibacter ginsengisoli DSM 18119 TaxID=1121884 RepID=A0A1M4U901_9BACT|nr:gamma-glutamyltransferase [Flavisolibacter ginsengisoli]SHE53050.1 gamma-glutamyltranspeptidase / glutathione hydrolase [Flavisolibacter ginsengisoli DSM 18119]
MKKLAPLLLLILFSCSSTKNVIDKNNVDPWNYSITKNLVAQKGAVVSAHPLASAVGVAILKKGGNAVDAAIATQLALAVVYPGAGNIGGGGFMVARLANGETLALDYREMAPSSSSRDMYLDANGNVVQGKSINGHLSSGVPGSIAGMFASMKYAKLSFKELIQPAIDLAEKGFAISEREASSLNSIQQDLQKYNTQPSAFLNSKGWKAGDTLVQKDLANTLKLIRDNGEAGFYKGKTAELIVEEMKRGGGIITLDDLKNYQVKWRTPHSFDYHGYTIVSMPMPSSGGILLHQMLKMLEDKPLSSYGFLSPQAVQLMTEVERRAFADRAEYMGDADFYKVPEAQLTNESYLKKRMNDYQPGIAGNSTQIKPGVLPMKESEQTTHLSVLDAEGNAVSVTTTLNNSYGSKTVIGGAGFFINDEMDDFSVKPGVPNLYGAVGGEANAIAPGKRMLSSMTPTLVLKDGKPFIVVGTPGGTTIPTSVFQTIVNIIDFGMSADDAVNKPKFHHQWLPDQIDVERSFPEATRIALQKMGYTIKERGSIGRTEVIKKIPGDGMEAVADKRGDDAAAGY